MAFSIISRLAGLKRVLGLTLPLAVPACGGTDPEPRYDEELRGLQDRYVSACRNAHSCQLSIPDSVADAKSALERHACFFKCSVTLKYTINGRVGGFTSQGVDHAKEQIMNEAIYY